MPGPIANPTKDKRDREYGWTTIPNEPSKIPAPALVGAGFDDRARETWAAWWATPMAIMWGRDFDADTLERLLHLRARQWAEPILNANGDIVNKPAAAELSEIRQLEDRFGLSPSARRKLYWRVEGVDIPDDKSTAPAEPNPSVSPKAGGEDDPRALRVVS